MTDIKCQAGNESCLGYNNGNCISIENCMHKEEKRTRNKYELDLDKVQTVDDCKKILAFLCSTSIKPLPNNLEYAGFYEVKQYFK